VYFCTVLKLNSDDVSFICLEAEISLEKKSICSLFYCANKPYTTVSNSNCSDGEMRAWKK